MIDLEDALARIVEARCRATRRCRRRQRRARQRRSHRRAMLVAAVVVVAIGTGGAIPLPADEPSEATDPPEPVDRVGARDDARRSATRRSPARRRSASRSSSQRSTCAAPDLPASYNLPYDFGHSFTVERHAPEEPGAVVGRYPTSDGHDLVVYSTTNGVDAVVQYEHWALVVGWNHDRTNWSAFSARVERT